MRLVISTPVAVAVDQEDVVHVRAEDPTGAFGILQGAEDLLTTLHPSVITWRLADGHETHCAVRGAVLTVTNGRTVSVAARDAVVSDDLSALEGEVLRHFREVQQKEEEARASAERLHVAAIRQIMSYLRPQGRAGQSYRREAP